MLLLCGAGFLAGAMNALAGGGSFVSLPALIAAGVPSVSANASSTVALYPGSAASVWVYRDQMGRIEALPIVPSLIVTLIGGLAGALLLLWTPSSLFDRVLPWLLLVATLMLSFGPQLGPALRRRFHAGPAVVVTIQLLLGVYGGYFGGAVGLMMMAVWSLLANADLKSLNPPRTLLVMAANTIALICFVVAGAVRVAGDAGACARLGVRRLWRRGARQAAAVPRRAHRHHRARRRHHRGVLRPRLLVAGQAARECRIHLRCCPCQGAATKASGRNTVPDRKSRHALALSAFAALAVLAQRPALADDYPTRNVTLVIPYPAGGGVDTDGQGDRGQAHRGARPSGHRREPPRRRRRDRGALRGEGRARRLHPGHAGHRHGAFAQRRLRPHQGFRADRHHRLDPDRGDEPIRTCR